MHLLPFPPFFSLTMSKTIPKKQQEQVTKKGKQTHVGMKPSNINQIHIHTIPTSCPILPTMHPKKTFYMHLAYSHPLNEHNTQHCSLHSFPHKRQSISAMFSSTKISQRNLKLPTYHTDPVLLTVSAYKTDYTYHAK